MDEYERYTDQDESLFMVVAVVLLVGLTVFAVLVLVG